MVYNPQWITAIATSVLAFLTFITIIIALFKEDILHYFHRPKIETIISNQNPFVIYGNREKDLKYFRVKIKNIGKTVAKNCHLRLIVVYPWQNSRPVISDPVTLKWAGSPLDSRYLIPANRPTINVNLKSIFKEKRDIPPFGGWEFCDLFKITKGGHVINFISSQEENRFLKRGNKNYLVYVNIIGDNFKPKIFSFIIKNNEDWDKISIEKT